MSSHLAACCAAEDPEPVRLRFQRPRALPLPPGTPRAWRPELARLEGYAFPWGYLVEIPNGLRDPAVLRGCGPSWRLLTTLLWEARRRARSTDIAWEALLAHANCDGTAVLARCVPTWLVCRVTERQFMGELVVVGERDARCARCWLAGWLLTRHIDAVLCGYRDCINEVVAIHRDRPFNPADREVLQRVFRVPFFEDWAARLPPRCVCSRHPCCSSCAPPPPCRQRPQPV
jgi:hypothetical protein